MKSINRNGAGSAAAMALWLWLVAIVIVLFAVAGCSTSSFDSNMLSDAIVMANTKDFSFDDWPADDVVVQASNISQDSLFLEVHFSGGCEDHDFGLIAFNYWLESHPVRAGVLLSHDAHGDLCEAAIQNTIAFDLTPARDAFRETYNTSDGQIVLNIQADGQTQATLTYSF